MNRKTRPEPLPIVPTSTGASTPAYACPHYRPLPGSKRCVSYDASGICTRDDEFVCVEWLRVNRR
jgi:hypothetical protein